MSEESSESSESSKNDEIAKVISLNAFKALTDSLVELENQGASAEVLMDKCVWPILQEASVRFSALARGEEDVPLSGFKYVVG